MSQTALKAPTAGTPKAKPRSATKGPSIGGTVNKTSASNDNGIASVGAKRRRKPFTVPCTITVRHSHDSLEAHVELYGHEPEIGDRITVHGAPITTRFGEDLCLDREATVRPANALEKAWIRFQAMFSLTELYEVSFSPRRF